MQSSLTINLNAPLVPALRECSLTIASPALSSSVSSISPFLQQLTPAEQKRILAFSSMPFNGDLHEKSPPSVANSTGSDTPSSNASNSSNTSNTSDDAKSCSDDDKDSTLATVNYLWDCGVWTVCSQKARFFDTNLFIKPRLAVISANNMENVNILSGVETYDYDPIAARYVASVEKFDDTLSVTSGFSSFHGSVAPQVSKFRKLGSFKNYVFFSNRMTSNLQNRLGQHAFGLEYQALYQYEARKFQFSMLRGDVKFVKDYRCGVEYLIFKFGRAAELAQLYGICERNDRHPERQPWCCKHIVSLDEMIQFFGVNDVSLQSKVLLLTHLKIDDNCVRKVFDPKMDFNPNLNKINRMLKHGFYDYHKGLERRANEYFSDDSSCSMYSNYSRRSNRCNRSNSCRKMKNEDKFCHLKWVANALNVNTRGLLSLIGDAIEGAFLFARKYPESVLTQAYIDEERGSITFELVLEAEICDVYNNKYYKFAVPIVQCQNMTTKVYYYEAKNILTPKMAVDNIRLNSPDSRLNANTWIYDLDNCSTSYYKRVDPTWFDNVAQLRAERKDACRLRRMRRHSARTSNTLNNSNPSNSAYSAHSASTALSANGSNAVKSAYNSQNSLNSLSSLNCLMPSNLECASVASGLSECESVLKAGFESGVESEFDAMSVTASVSNVSNVSNVSSVSNLPNLPSTPCFGNDAIVSSMPSLGSLRGSGSVGSMGSSSADSLLSKMSSCDGDLSGSEADTDDDSDDSDESDSVIESVCNNNIDNSELFGIGCTRLGMLNRDSLECAKTSNLSGTGAAAAAGVRGSQSDINLNDLNGLKNNMPAAKPGLCSRDSKENVRLV